MIFDALQQELAPVRVQRSFIYYKKYLEDKNNPTKDTANRERNMWLEHTIEQEQFDQWKALAIPQPTALLEAIKILPRGSWAICFDFTLKTPYLSHGIEAFDYLENGLIRDPVFEVPIISATSWKGGLRAAALAIVMEAQGLEMTATTITVAEKDERIIRLFGNSKDEMTDFQQGRLTVFMTGFRKTSCIVLNPMNRPRRVGSQPILLECVPPDHANIGTFTALYCTPAQDATKRSEQWQTECWEDSELVGKAIRDLLTVWGIGAKKSSGNGNAQEAITNVFLLTNATVIVMLPFTLSQLPSLMRDNYQGVL